jgi:hypothetical protein
MRFLHSASLLKNISFVTASHLGINSETRLAAFAKTPIAECVTDHDR